MREPGLSTDVLICLLGPYSRAEALRSRCEGRGVRCIVTDDAYAAAIELLRAPRAALAIEASALRTEQAGLLDLAERRGATAVGLGDPPAWPEAATGRLRFVAEDDLLESLDGPPEPAATQEPDEEEPSGAGTREHPEAPEAEEEPEAKASEAKAPEPEERTTAFAPPRPEPRTDVVRQATGPHAEPGRDLHLAAPPPDRPEDRAAPREAPPRPLPREASDVLTPEEIAALLDGPNPSVADE